MYNDKLRLFFKSKGLKQKEVAELLDVSASSLGRYLMGTDNFKPEFLTALIREFPEIDLRYIFGENYNTNMVKEMLPFYGLNDDTIIKELEIIENKVANVREYLAQKCHWK